MLTFILKSIFPPLLLPDVQINLCISRNVEATVWRKKEAGSVLSSGALALHWRLTSKLKTQPWISNTTLPDSMSGRKDRKMAASVEREWRISR